jgi:hypothetical protein
LYNNAYNKCLTCRCTCCYTNVQQLPLLLYVMSNSNLLTFRCPEDLREAIAGLMADTSKDRTAVVTMLLRLGLAAYNSGQTDVVRGEPDVIQAQAVPIEETVQTIVASMLQGVQQRLTEVEQRLGEFERLKDSGEGSLRPAEVLAERNRLDERVSDLLLQVENLKDELNECRQQSAVANESLQNCPPLEEMRDRVLHELKLGKQAPGYKSAVKALNLFIDLFGTTRSTPNGIKGN